MVARTEHILSTSERGVFIVIGALGVVVLAIEHIVFLVPAWPGIIVYMAVPLVPVLLSSRHRLLRQIVRGMILILAIPLTVMFTIGIVLNFVEWMPWVVKVAYGVFFGGIAAIVSPQQRSSRVATLLSICTMIAFTIMVAFSLNLAREDLPLRQAGWSQIWR